MGADGELITYTYDIANRLVRVQDVMAMLLYTYNGDGDRVAKAVDGVTTTCVVAVLGLAQMLIGLMSFSVLLVKAGDPW